MTLIRNLWYSVHFAHRPVLKNKAKTLEHRLRPVCLVCSVCYFVILIIERWTLSGAECVSPLSEP
jgi:hypothetical protein